MYLYLHRIGRWFPSRRALVPWPLAACCQAAVRWLAGCCFKCFVQKKTKKYAMTSTRRHLTKGKKLPDNLTFDTHHEQKKVAR
jgi:hypothetical protein